MKKLMQITISFLSFSVISLAQVSELKILPGDGTLHDEFGYSVSISGDYAIVGALFGDNYFGSAYIFRRDGASWIEEQELTASDGAAGDKFGCSVSISGNYTVVGAQWDDDYGENSGSAYIFRRDGTNWIEEQKLTASDGAEDDDFGGSVSISGDTL
ncbi:MAG: FG-GAP repeat protein, partial [Ignavibacteria bacterium]|nr:FG-GAP repeat protein [Ignavibacteria bacterium]